MKLETFNEYFINTPEEPLTEGVRFFKISERLDTLLKKFDKAYDKTIYPNEKEILSLLIRKTKRLRNKFIKIEHSYRNAETNNEKRKIKKEYKEISENYKEILNVMKKEETKEVLKRISLFGITIATMAIPLKILYTFTGYTQIIDPTDSNWINMLKRTGIYSAIAIPTQAVGAGLRKIIDKGIDSGTKDDLDDYLAKRQKKKR
jgi:hypothetical protein